MNKLDAGVEEGEEELAELIREVGTGVQVGGDVK